MKKILPYVLTAAAVYLLVSSQKNTPRFPVYTNPTPDFPGPTDVLVAGIRKSRRYIPVNLVG